MSSTLRLFRGQRMVMSFDRKRSWTVLLDDETARKIAHDDTLEIAVEPGHHSLMVTSTKKRRSPERTFDIRDESVVEFACHTQPIWPLLLMALVVPSRWIVLKERR